MERVKFDEKQLIMFQNFKSMHYLCICEGNGMNINRVAFSVNLYDMINKLKYYFFPVLMSPFS